MGKFSIIAATVLLSAASALAQTGGADGKFKRANSNATGSVKLDMVSVTRQTGAKPTSPNIRARSAFWAKMS